MINCSHQELAATTTPGKHFFSQFGVWEEWGGPAFAERTPSLPSTWRKKKWCKVLEFKPGLDWSFLLGSQTVLSLGRKRGSEQGGICQQREAKQCGVVRGRCHFPSETGVTVLGLLGQLRGAPSWTTPGCTIRPPGCCVLAL